MVGALEGSPWPSLPLLAPRAGREPQPAQPVPPRPLHPGSVRGPGWGGEGSGLRSEKLQQRRMERCGRNGAPGLRAEPLGARGRIQGAPLQLGVCPGCPALTLGA